METLANPSFSDQVVALRPLLVRMARQRLRNDAWAEDAVSETLVAALENPAGFGGRATVKTWLAGILKHKVVDQIRRHTRECQAETFDDEEPEFGELHDAAPAAAFEAQAAQAEWGDPQERLSRRQFMAHFDQCLKALPPQQSRAFMLRNWMEEETEDICRQLGVTSNNLAVMLHRARNRLRASLQAQWMGPAIVAAPAGRG
jgi:RNA polymerase sigma-70 factor (ECF subfamily)